MTSKKRNRPDGTNQNEHEVPGDGRPEAERGDETRGDGARDDEEMQRLITDALGTYSADGQADDATGGDAGAEAAFGHEAHPRGVKQTPTSPDGPRIGPS